MSARIGLPVDKGQSLYTELCRQGTAPLFVS